MLLEFHQNTTMKRSLRMDKGLGGTSVQAMDGFPHQPMEYFQLIQFLVRA